MIYIKRLDNTHRHQQARKTEMNFSHRNSRLLSTFGFIGILFFLYKHAYVFMIKQAKFMKVNSDLPIDILDVFSLLWLSSISVMLWKLISYYYHEFLGFSNGVKKEIILQSNQNYKELIRLPFFLFSLLISILFGCVAFENIHILLQNKIISIIFSTIFSIVFILISHTKYIVGDLSLKFKFGIDAIFVTFILVYLLIMAANIDYKNSCDIIFSKEGAIEYNIIGEEPKEIIIKIINTQDGNIIGNTIIDNSKLSKAFLEFTSGSSSDTVEKSQPLINIENCLYKYNYIDSLKKYDIKSNSTYYYIVEIKYSTNPNGKKIKVVNEFTYTSTFKFTQHKFRFSPKSVLF